MNHTYSSANAYSRVGMETGVADASPHKLILMLYDGAILAVSNAILYMGRNEIARKGESVSHAISIIDNGLKACLDMNSGGEIAKNLSMLYEYMSNRLLLANLKNDPAGLDEVRKLLLDLKGAWAQIDSQTPHPAAPIEPQAMPKRSGMSYGQA